MIADVLPLGGSFKAPHLDYAALSPMLVIWAVATLGVLVEAVVPRGRRWVTQVSLSFAGLIGALIAVVALAGTQKTAAVGTVAVDGPALFLEGTLLALAIASLLFISERSVDTGGGAFTQQASVLPGSAEERHLAASDRQQTEVYPLVMFSVGGMLMFATAHNLLAMEAAGLHGSRLFAPSWSGYVSDPSRPIATGATSSP